MSHVKGCAGNVALLSSYHMSDPSPSSSHDDGSHAVLVAAGEKMLVGDGLGPGYSQDSLTVLRVQSGQFVEVAFSQPPAIMNPTVGTVSAWSWCYTGITSTCCLAF